MPVAFITSAVLAEINVCTVLKRLSWNNKSYGLQMTNMFFFLQRQINKHLLHVI